jgi:hypothetical protein
MGNCISGAGGGGAPRVGDTMLKDNGRTVIQFRIDDINSDGSARIQVTRSTMPGYAKYGEGKKVLVDASFLEKNTKKLSSSKARLNDNTYLGSEREQAFKAIPSLESGSIIRATYANGGISTYTVSKRNGKTVITSNKNRRGRIANTASAVSNIVGRPMTVEIRKQKRQ